MFFSIAQQSQQNYSHHYQLGSFAVSTDAGWVQQHLDDWHVVYKGYADNAPLSTLLDTVLAESTPNHLGNFCVLAYNRASHCLHIKTDRYRSFPIYIKSGSKVGNLTSLDSTVWTDGVITIDPDFNIVETKFDAIGSINSDSLTLQQSMDLIDQRLNLRTENFVRYNDRPIKVFLSGGVDSLLVYSYLQKYTDKFEFVTCDHVDYDRFWLLNSATLQKSWAYRQIHHWKQSCILTSGTPGDEFMMRSPTTTDLFLKFHDIQVSDLLQDTVWQDCLHRDYFQKHLDLFDNQPAPPCHNKDQLIHYLCNIIANDWQHQHIGNTLTWTPLRDLEIFKTLLRLPVDDLIPQIMSSTISIQLIEQNQPGLSRLISNQKNNSTPMENLIEFYGL